MTETPAKSPVSSTREIVQDQLQQSLKMLSDRAPDNAAAALLFDKQLLTFAAGMEASGAKADKDFTWQKLDAGKELAATKQNIETVSRMLATLPEKDALAAVEGFNKQMAVAAEQLPRATKPQQQEKNEQKPWRVVEIIRDEQPAKDRSAPKGLTEKDLAELRQHLDSYTPNERVYAMVKDLDKATKKTQQTLADVKVTGENRSSFARLTNNAVNETIVKPIGVASGISTKFISPQTGEDLKNAALSIGTVTASGDGLPIKSAGDAVLAIERISQDKNLSAKDKRSALVAAANKGLELLDKEPHRYDVDGYDRKLFESVKEQARLETALEQEKPEVVKAATEALKRSQQPKFDAKKEKSYQDSLQAIRSFGAEDVKDIGAPAGIPGGGVGGRIR